MRVGEREDLPWQIHFASIQNTQRNSPTNILQCICAQVNQ
jgi:hypothetical protein